MVKSPSCACPNMTKLFTLLGKKWSIFIMHAISLDHHTFTTIREHTGRPNTKILTDRLNELVESGILEKCITEGSYGLTPLGKDLTRKIIGLGEWWANTSEK